jgi:hypothetical protein
MDKKQWDVAWDLLRGSFPAMPLSNEVTKVVWFNAFRSIQAEVFVDAVKVLARTADRPAIKDIMDLCMEIAPTKQPLLTTPQVSEERSAETYEQRLAREESNYQATLAQAGAQLLHERTCADCRTYSEPNATQDRTGVPCAVGKRFWEPYYKANGNRWSVPKYDVRRKP